MPKFVGLAETLLGYVSISMLLPVWQKLSLSNPVVYLR